MDPQAEAGCAPITIYAQDLVDIDAVPPGGRVRAVARPYPFRLRGATPVPILLLERAEVLKTRTRRCGARRRGAGRPRAVVRASSRGGDSGDPDLADEHRPSQEGAAL
jgi:hypothetical protein